MSVRLSCSLTILFTWLHAFLDLIVMNCFRLFADVTQWRFISPTIPRTSNREDVLASNQRGEIVLVLAAMALHRYQEANR